MLQLRTKGHIPYIKKEIHPAWATLKGHNERSHRDAAALIQIFVN